MRGFLFPVKINLLGIKFVSNIVSKTTHMTTQEFAADNMLSYLKTKIPFGIIRSAHILYIPFGDNKIMDETLEMVSRALPNAWFCEKAIIYSAWRREFVNSILIKSSQF